MVNPRIVMRRIAVAGLSVFVSVVTGLALASPATLYTHDVLGRINSVIYSDGTTIIYTYDADGNRLSQVISNPAIPLPKVAIDRSTLTFSAAVGQTSGNQVIAVTNAGGGNLQWVAVATASWLVVTPGSGTNSGAVNVTASAAGMSVGTYNANVMILASASNPSVTIPVTFAVTAAQGNPSISSGGIVSAAGSSPGIARGSVASLFGTSLADGPSQATTTPLPRTLGKTQVAVNGVSAPLWYADSNQINFQVPFESPLQGQASVVVTRSGVASSPMNVTLTPYAPSVFTYQRASGVFDPIIVHSADNQLVTPTNPAVPGEYLVVYGTGIGDLTVLPATDAPSPTGPPATAKVTPTATIGGVNAPVAFAGLTPGGIGLAQFNIQVPTGLPSGSSLPLVINFNGAVSQPVNLAIGSGSGTTTATANVQYTFTPSTVSQSPDGKWYYSTILQETSGVGVTFTKMVSNGIDYTSSITSWFGATRLPAKGQLQGNFTATCDCNPPWDANWNLTGNDDNGHTGLSWSGVVHFVAPVASGIGTVISGLSAFAQGLAVDSARNVYYGDNNSIKRVSTSGTVTVIAGNATAGFSGDGGPATSAQLHSPLGVAVDQAGNIYIADYSNARIRKVDIHGTITTFAGNGQYADSGDGGPATSAAFRELKNVSVDSQGNVYVVTALTVRRIDTTGIITTVAGDPSCIGGFRGDGGPGPQACLYAPNGVAGSASLLYIADELNYRIRKVDHNGTISTFAGNGSGGFTASGGPALQVAIGLPTGIAMDASGNVFFSDCLNQQISMISSSTAMMTTVAGTGVKGFSGDNGAPNQAQMSCPMNLAFGPDGALYVLDSSNLRIRRIVLVP